MIIKRNNVFRQFFQVLLVIVLFGLSLYVWANSIDTVEVFLGKDDVLDPEQTDIAHEEGLTLVIYQLDVLDTLQKEISQNAETYLKPSMDAVHLQVGDAAYASMSDEERTDKVMKSFGAHKGRVETMKNALVTPAMREKLRRAYEDSQYAADHGIGQNDLPALLFNNTVYKQSTDIGAMLDKIDNGQ